MRRAGKGWFRVASAAMGLGMDASQVMALRAMALARGGKAAEREARRMVEEKLRAAVALQALAMTGGLGTTLHSASGKAVSHYGKAVRANKRRLLKGKPKK